MADETQLKQRLGLFDATTILVGSMIGSGIFLAPAFMAQRIQSPGLLIGLWIFGGLFTVLGALSYAELAAMFPKAGGQYVYLREAFGGLWAFLFGWTLFFVIQSGFNAAVAIAFAKYAGYFSATGELPNWAVQLIACKILVLLTFVNILGVKAGANVQNLFTVLKVGALVALFAGGIAKLGIDPARFQPMFDRSLGPEAIGKLGFAAAVAVAMSKALFAYDAWNTLTFVGEEVREPQKNLPRALLLGSLVVMVVYVLTNVAFLAAVPIGEMALVKDNRIGQAAATVIFGPVGTTFVVAAILVSTFGCVNGLILGGARVIFAMAREGLFFAPCGKLHPRFETPAFALAMQCIWSCILAISGSYDALLTYTVFASVLFGALTVVGLFVLRNKRPVAERPYRCWGYPVTPLLYLAIAAPFLIYVIQGDPKSTGIGLLLVATGLPAYWFWNRNRP